MQRTFLKSKIHRATITGTVLTYEGSITLDPQLMETADIKAYEKVQVLNLNNGARFETYVIPGAAGDKQVCLNGPAARLGEAGDIIIVVSATPKRRKSLCAIPLETYLNQCSPTRSFEEAYFFAEFCRFAKRGGWIIKSSMVWVIAFISAAIFK